MMVSLQEVTFGYGDHPVLDGANLTLEPGQTVGLLGLNGSGKTTTMRLMAKILEPRRGRVVRSFRKLGYLPEERGLYRKMQVGRYLEFIAALDGISGREAHLVSGTWMERFQLEGYATDRIETLSKGNQQKVQLAATLMGHPDLLLWDEPFSGLDALNQDLLVGVLEESRREGVTILLSTHRIEDLESWADTHYIIAQQKFHHYRPPAVPETYIIEPLIGSPTTVRAQDLTHTLNQMTAQGDVIRQIKPDSGLRDTFRKLLGDAHGTT